MTPRSIITTMRIATLTKGLGLYVAELEQRMNGRALHYPADQCANCDLRRAITVLQALLAALPAEE